jgi:signal transduction histidine kinase
MNTTVQTHTDILRLYLAPYLSLLALFLLVIGGGGSWLYLSARHAQTELVTQHILDVIRPTLKELEAEQTKKYDLSKLSEKVVNLYSTLPHLRQISVRDRHKGYGVRLTSNRQLVDVELEPLSPNSAVQPDSQALAHQLHHKDGPLFHVYFALTAANHDPVQVDIAFDRRGLTEDIATSMQSLIHSIVIFSSLGLVSLLFALGLSVYIGKASQKMGARLQTIYQQAAMGKLSADFVHDLRNPLASIRANIKNLLITPEQTDEIVAEMDQDLMRLEGKLSYYLKLTKPRTGDFTVVDLDELVQDIVRQCSPLFKEKRQFLAVDIAPSIAKLPVMPESLSDALINLLVNARDHAPEQGHVRLQVRNIGTQVEIMIEDDGPGIDADVMPHIFEPFFTTRTDGHGLGLAIVGRIIKAHNGTVKALDRPEGGARFVITLPVKHYDD